MARKRKVATKVEKGRSERARLKSEQVSTEVSTLEVPDSLPVITSRDLVPFPSVMISLHITRQANVEALSYASEQSDGLLLVLGQKRPEAEEPAIDELNSVGVIAQAAKVLTLSDGRLKVLLQGLLRAKVKRIFTEGHLFKAAIEVLESPLVKRLTKRDIEAIERIKSNLQTLIQYELLPEEMLLVVEEISDPGMLSDVVLAHYKLPLDQAQRLLEELDPLKRLHGVDQLLAEEMQKFLIGEHIRDRTRDELNKGQRDYFLREQLKQIQRELGEQDGEVEDIQNLKSSIEKANLPTHVAQEADRQLRRLERMSSESSDYALLRTYLDWVIELPWNKRSQDRLDLKLVRKVLDEDHYGLERVKERIIEYLSVRKLNPDSRGPILCFVGPPGVGKTSLGKSIARALGREFFRMSLGGMRDEAEIRGHRRTYVGALPGRIIQGLKQAGTLNPVFVLDELDKIGADFRGDPAAALLEVLDPHQNQDFRDHYLGVGVDLSEILFIATANTLDTIPDALLDRLETIHIPGYTTEEKLSISNRFLIPRQLKENGLTKFKVAFDSDALLLLIERYTHEAGVRNLEREIGALCRKVAKEYVERDKKVGRITVESVRRFLGPTKYDPEADDRSEMIGLARGLAWTINGGELMPVEASTAKGSGQLILTGQLGEVMRESAQAALFYARANSVALGLEDSFHSKYDIHVHVPGGATPKDGPSAGITIASAIISALSQRTIARDVAMTGEITLRGNVLAIGGLKEKALAALRYGITRIIIPHDNIKDLDEIPKDQRTKINFIPVKHVREVLQIVLKEKKKAQVAKIKSKVVLQNRKSARA